MNRKCHSAGTGPNPITPRALAVGTNYYCDSIVVKKKERCRQFRRSCLHMQQAALKNAEAKPTVRRAKKRRSRRKGDGTVRGLYSATVVLKWRFTRTSESSYNHLGCVLWRCICVSCTHRPVIMINNDAKEKDALLKSRFFHSRQNKPTRSAEQGYNSHYIACPLHLSSRLSE